MTIDFVSTRTNTDQQTAACARLLAAVIAAAIVDAREPFSSKEKADHRNDEKARAAISFLFDNTSVFPLYAKLIGSSHLSMRRALLERDINEMARSSITSISSYDRKIIRQRLRIHQQHAAAVTANERGSLVGDAVML